MPNWVGQHLGNYRLIRRLGKGGFGEVYLGEHLHLQTHAAIKLVLEEVGQAHLEAFGKDFVTEARRIATLKHPHIVRVLDFGLQKATPYLVMEYAAHGSLLERHQRGSHVPLAQVVSYTQQIAQALDYAHQKQLIHRDVKPANLLLDEQDRVLLSDFGIATVAHHTSSMRTNKNEVAGTPAYMAPEQLLGKPEPASDQYALAIMVYEWLCSQLPYQGDQWSVGMQHLTAPIPSLRHHNQALSGEVEAAVQRAMAKDPKQRFASVLDFAQALEEAYLAEQAAASPTPAMSIPAETLPATRVAPVERLPLPIKAKVPQSSFPSHQRQSQQKVNIQATSIPAVGTRLFTYEHSGGWVHAVAWSPDGKRIVSAGYEPSICIWDALTGHALLSFRAPPYHRAQAYHIYAVAWSPDGRLLASGNSNGGVRVWEATTGKFVCSYKGHTSWQNSVVWSPDGKLLASGSQDRTVQVWEVATGEAVCSYRGHSGKVESVAWSPDGKLLASGSSDHTVQVWEAISGKIVCSRGHSGKVESVAWSPDGKLLASGGSNHTVQVWEAISGKIVDSYKGHAASVESVAWSPDGKWLASGSHDDTVQVWNVSMGKVVLTYRAHNYHVHAVAWSPDGTLIASVSHDVHVWQAPSI